MRIHIQIEDGGEFCDVRLGSHDGTNRLTRACVAELSQSLLELRREPKPLILSGNARFFSAGADLTEIQALTAATAFEFARMGQRLMRTIAEYPCAVYAAIQGYCMGGGLDLALACHCRIASPHAVFGHRGAALGLITGWGGTQRLPRLIGKGRALEIFLAAEKIHATQALRLGLIDGLAEDPITEAAHRIKAAHRTQTIR